MLNKLLKSLLVIAVSLASVSAHALTQDEAKIRSNINSFSALADQGAYQHLGRLFAKVLVVDYTSLWGGEPSTTTNVELMKQWAGFLPGFDTTFHELSNLDVVMESDNAIATVDFTASHWLGEEGFWSVSGSYQFKLNRSGDNWVINSVKLNFEDEAGSRDVLSEAPKHAENNHEQRQSRLVRY